MGEEKEKIDGMDWKRKMKRKKKRGRGGGGVMGAVMFPLLHTSYML